MTEIPPPSPIVNQKLEIKIWLNASYPDPRPAFTSVYSRYLLKWKSEYPNIVENTEISRFLCHKLRILCVRKSERWHAWVRFIPQTALVRAFHCDTKFLLNQFSPKMLMPYYPIFTYNESCVMMCFKFVRESLKANFSKCNLINIRKGANGAIVWMFRNFCIYVTSTLDLKMLKCPELILTQI